MRKVPKDQLGTCVTCEQPVYPGDFVGETADGKPIHAGFHFSMSEQDAICETGAIGIGFWNGTAIDRSNPSAASVAMSTGVAVVQNVGPGIVEQHKVPL